MNKYYGGQLEFTVVAVPLGVLDAHDICSVCHLFCKRVQLYVHHPEEVVSIHLKVNGLERRRLGGFPNSMARFLRQQRLDSQFGNAEHDASRSIKCGACGIFNLHPIGLDNNRRRKSEQVTGSVGNSRKRAKSASGRPRGESMAQWACLVKLGKNSVS